MCGIVGYVGKSNAKAFLINGLEKLEYRGYDSAGIAIFDGNSLVEKKYKGRLSVLSEAVMSIPLDGKLGIGHTRWATHGEPSDVNAHPHFSYDKKISVVHNGIIENYISLKKELIEDGVVFASDTDTEVVAHLVAKHYKGDILSAVSAAVNRLKGAYALVIVCRDEPEKLIAVRKDSPLIAGIGEGGNFIASDIPAILEYTRKIYLLENGTIAALTADSIQLYTENLAPITQEVFNVTWSASAATKSGYDHYMLKEIHEQPDAIRNTLRTRLNSDSDTVIFEGFNLTKQEYDAISKVVIVACGTAYYAGAYGKYIIEKFTRKPVEIEVASEFRYKNPLIDDKTLFIAISQSGETADTLESLRLAKAHGAKTLALTNVLGSTVDREADITIYTLAGPEIAVASTKAYSTQIVCMCLLAMQMGKLSSNTTDEMFKTMRDALIVLPDIVSAILNDTSAIKTAAEHMAGHRDAFFIGRGTDYCLSMEGSLKMKEISYIHSEAFQAGELKHGPIALLEKGTPVIALCTRKDILTEKTFSSIQEVKTRGAYVLAITQRSNEQIASAADEVLYIDDMDDDTAIVPAVVILQLLAYYTAVKMNRDVDKPRNLAKSVTVE